MAKVWLPLPEQTIGSFRKFAINWM